jgi:hypothetical protein
VAATIAVSRISKDRYAVKESEIERFRQRLRKMSNPELLLFGVTTKCQLFVGDRTTARSYPRTTERSPKRVEETKSELTS